MRLHKKHPIEKCTENTHLKLRYKINGTFLRHSVYTFVLQNIIVHLLKITLQNDLTLLYVAKYYKNNYIKQTVYFGGIP